MEMVHIVPWVGYNYIKNGNIDADTKISNAKFTYNIDTTDNNDYWCFSAPGETPVPPEKECSDGCGPLNCVTSCTGVSEHDCDSKYKSGGFQCIALGRDCTEPTEDNRETSADCSGCTTCE